MIRYLRDRNEFITIETLFNSVYQDFIASGFISIYKDSVKFTVECSNLVDPLAQKQPWRIHFDSSYILNYTKYTPKVESSTDTSLYESTMELSVIDEIGRIVVGTSHNLYDDGTVKFNDTDSILYDMSVSNFLQNIKLIRTKEEIKQYPGTAYCTQVDTLGTRFSEFGASGYIPYGDISPVFSKLSFNSIKPIGYIFSVSEYGFALAFKANADPYGKGMKWICVQRLVDAIDGKIYVDYYSPVVCLTNHIERQYVKYSKGTLSYLDTGDKCIWHVTVREADRLLPSRPKMIYRYDDYLSGVWNVKKQQDMSESGQGTLILIDGLTTDRHLLHNKCVDLVAYTNGTIINEGNTCNIRLYEDPPVSEITHRFEYTALRSTMGYSEGQRLLIQTG